MGIPNLSANDVEKLISHCTVVGSALKGGQKIVFPCIIDGKKVAVKFILLSNNFREMGPRERESIEGIISRAKREHTDTQRVDRRNEGI